MGHRGSITGVDRSHANRFIVLRRFVRRFRRPIAAVLAALAVLAAIAAVRPAPAPTVEIVVASDDLPAGAQLTAGDLMTIPSTTPPPGAINDPQRLIDEVITAPVAQGEPITATRLLSHALDHDPTRVAVPVRMSDPGLAMVLAPGQPLDLVAPGGRTLAHDARVITVPRTSTGALSGARPGSLVLVAVLPEDATRLAGSSGDTVSPILH